MKIDTVRAFYFGTAYLVEVDIVLPENMVLKEAHDIGESLQKKIEDIPDVERVCLNKFFVYSIDLIVLSFRHLFISIMNTIIILRLNIKLFKTARIFFSRFIIIFLYYVI